MYYIILTFLTFLKTIICIGLLKLDVFAFSPYIVRLWFTWMFFAMLLWTFMLITEKRRWTYILNFLFDIWIIGNLIYFRSYGDILNRWCLENANNMTGLWSSILPFFHSIDLLFPLLSVIWIIVSEVPFRLYRLPIQYRWSAFVVCLLVLAIPNIITSKKVGYTISPFSKQFSDISMGRLWYIHNYGPIAHFINECVQYVTNKEQPAFAVKPKDIKPYLCETDAVQGHFMGNLIIISFESLENWLIHLRVNGEEVTPNLNRLINSSSCTYTPMQAQVRQGKSSDAWLIVTTGLLPIHDGAVSMRYASNTFPSFVRFANVTKRIVFIPEEGSLWNQTHFFSALGFDSLYAHPSTDRDIMELIWSNISTEDSSFIIMATTMASHSPFITYKDSSELKTDNLYPTHISNYMRCINYTDKCIGVLLNHVLDDSTLSKNTRIIIFGDHPFFETDRDVPFILYDPFEGSTTVNRTFYQSDIYSTIVERMHIHTKWKGFGRPISDTTIYFAQESMYSLSDRIIRTDYFSTCSVLSK